MAFTLTNLLLILLIAWISGRLVSRLGYPPVLGELAAGIVFGPAMLGIIHGDEGTVVLGQLGVMLMMVYIGMSIDLQELMQSFNTAIVGMVGGFIAPFALGYGAMLALGYDGNAALIVGCIITATTLAVVPRLVMDLNLLDKRIGQTLAGIALLSVAVTLIAFALVKSVVEAGSVEMGALAVVLGKVVIFLIVAIGVGLWGFPWFKSVLRRVGLPGREAAFTLVILIGLAYSVLSEVTGLVLILGSFLAGVFLTANTFEEGIFEQVKSAMKDASLGFLTPVFFVATGFDVSLSIFTENLPLLLLILGAAMGGKVLGGALSYLVSGRDWREGLVVGIGMNGRGGIDIVMSGIALQIGVVDSEVFTALILTIFLSTLSVTILLKIGANWLDKQGLLAASG